MDTLTAKQQTIEDLLKPKIITCGNCGGDLHIIPIRNGNKIETINICGNCTFKKEK